MNVGEWIFKRAAICPEGPFLKEEEARSFTNREFDERVNRIAHFKLPKKIIFVEEFPRNSVGKILKKELKGQLL